MNERKEAEVTGADTPPPGSQVGIYGVCPVPKRIPTREVGLIRRNCNSPRAIGRVVDGPIIEEYKPIGVVETVGSRSRNLRHG